MAGISKNFDSLRLNRLDGGRLALALLLSLALHLLVWGGYELNKEFNILGRLPVHKKKIAAQTQPVVQEAEPQIFLDVTEASPEAPKKAKYYSDKNSRAADKESADSNVPKLNGSQTDFMKLQNSPRSKNSSAPPPPEPQLAKNETQPQPKPVVKAGDGSPAPPQNLPEQKVSPPPRPRTLKEARADMQGLHPGVESQTEGGTRRAALVPSLDAKATPFGEYDGRFIEAVRQRWYDLLDSHGFAADRTGKVTLRFHLNYDGRITDMQVLDNSVGELLCLFCQDAVTDPAPFAPWPSDMRRIVGENYREITFTFYYY
ncbi:MAG TPA: hypothetical protein VIK59_07805 [Verrucomicrobiae bacterium]